MDLINRVLNGLEERRNKLLNGGINSIPSPFIRFREDFLGIEQGKYYVVTGSTKSAKTQLASYLFIYNTLIYAYEHPNQLRVKVFYYPLEETPEDIMTRFMSFLLYTKSNFTTRISSTDLNSTRNNQILDSKILETLKKDDYLSILKFFEDNVIFSMSGNPTGVYNECKRYAEEHGTTHTKKQTIKGELGETKIINTFDWYESSDPDEYRIIFYDHVSLTNTEKGLTLKQSIDKLSEYCVLLRNRYNFSPVIVQQQAFENESLENIKFNKVRPTVAGAADSKYTMRDCNVALGIFSPFKYELKEYFGYDITRLRDNCRFLEVLINRGGSPGGIIALYFDGAVNFFSELPRADSKNIQNVYMSLQKFRSTSKSFFSYSIKELNKGLHKNKLFNIFAVLFNKK